MSEALPALSIYKQNVPEIALITCFRKKSAMHACLKKLLVTGAAQWLRKLSTLCGKVCPP
jgi:hypothetical protein